MQESGIGSWSWDLNPNPGTLMWGVLILTIRLNTYSLGAWASAWAGVVVYQVKLPPVVLAS